MLNLNLFYTLAMCEQCCKARKAEEHKAQTNYTNATIYVRKVNDDKEIYVYDKVFTSSSVNSEGSSVGSSQESTTDPDFTQVRKVLVYEQKN